MEKNDWREELQEIIEEEETDMERPMIPRYAKGYAKLVLENFISSVIEKERKKLVSDINDALKDSIKNNESVSKVIEKIDIKVFDVDESSTIRVDMVNMVDKEIEKAEERGKTMAIHEISKTLDTEITRWRSDEDGEFDVLRIGFRYFRSTDVDDYSSSIEAISEEDFEDYESI